MHFLKALFVMTVASTKMYVRDFTAMFFSLIFPIIFLVVFGFIYSRDEAPEISLAVFNESSSVIADQLEKAIEKNPVLIQDKELENLDAAKQKIKEGDLHFALLIPEKFGVTNPKTKIPYGELQGFYSAEDQEFASIAQSSINLVIEEFNREATKIVTGVKPLQVFEIKSETVESNELKPINFAVPGIIAFSIMSLGIFSISQGFISFKSSGSLRRLFVAPLHPISFIIAQTIARLGIVIVNVLTMLLIGILFFDFTLIGDVFNFLLLSLLGTVLFLGFGFAIAGWAKNENQAAPISNIIFFPMMFLSGIFFPRELFPEWMQPITAYSPLTFLTDGLREIANNGATVLNLGTEILGMTVWIIVVYFIAARIFRWE